MSIQFGRWTFDDVRADPDYLRTVRSLLRPYGPDDEGFYCGKQVNILYFAFHTTKESQCEAQPCVTKSGIVLTWDGRLDNRRELGNLFRNELGSGASDAAIVAAAYERWATDCFARLIGDWALTVWDPKRRALILAKDFVGSRHLYYSLYRSQITWSTVLDPLVLLTNHPLRVREEYIAGWLASFPAAHMTPYCGIDAVPPGGFVRLEPARQTIVRYWNFSAVQRVRYSTDAEYEEHFRDVFAQAVRRRLRSDRPILAELSGGMDSSSIVCVADLVLASGGAETPRLDTVSYYNDSEPNWNERPFFAKVEEKRGRIGCHIDLAMQGKLLVQYPEDHLATTPTSGAGQTGSAQPLLALLQSQGIRVVLSGLGGDETLGGVPTPIPELADLLAHLQLRQFGRQLITWAMAKRKPLLHLCAETIQSFLPRRVVPAEQRKRAASWVSQAFAQRNLAALQGYESRIRLLGPARPSLQENLGVLEALRRQLACTAPCASPPYERRYPFLDRDLLTFLYAVPREQLVRPNQRRSLQRRALRGLVPQEILDRKRKAFVERAPIQKICRAWPNLVAMVEDMKAVSLGIVDRERFLSALKEAAEGRAYSVIPVERAVLIESWLQHLGHWNTIIDLQLG